MEIEMKYGIPDKEIADNIWTDPDLLDISDMSSAESLVMKAVYFDTDDCIMSKNNISVRVRAEGEHYFATLKANGSHKDGMFTREEINVPVSDDASFMALDPSVFAGSENGDRLIELLKGKKLRNLLEMRFLRRRKRMNYAGSIMELALDSGSIITDNGEMPIMEMEIELFAGEPAAIEALGKKISEKYGLSVKNTSKFKDGLILLGAKDLK